MTVTRLTYRNDPTEVITMANGYEMVEAAIQSFMDDGEVPHTVLLMDQEDDEHDVEIDFIDKSMQCALETLSEGWPDGDWDDCKPIVEALFVFPKKWLATDHEVETC